MRQIIVYNGIMEKFRQNPTLKTQLISTGNKILVKCVTDDRVWGNEPSPPKQKYGHRKIQSLRSSTI